MARVKDSELQELFELVRAASGIQLDLKKRSLVEARLRGHMIRNGFRSLGSYLTFVKEDGEGKELRRMIDLISTNVTSFFREGHHFDHLKQQLASPQGTCINRYDVRVWSAASSSGEEPYSLAITLAEELGEHALRRFLILATDISTRMVSRAHNGLYPSKNMTGISPQHQMRWFSQTSPARFQVVKELRDRVRARRLNLLDPWPMQKQFDVIFCRNCLIYFDAETQASLARRFYRQLKPGGLFYIGHSESLAGMEHDFEYVMPTVYKRSLNS